MPTTTTSTCYRCGEHLTLMVYATVERWVHTLRRNEVCVNSSGKLGKAIHTAIRVEGLHTDPLLDEVLGGA